MKKKRSSKLSLGDIPVNTGKHQNDPSRQFYLHDILSMQQTSETSVAHNKTTLSKTDISSNRNLLDKGSLGRLLVTYVDFLEAGNSKGELLADFIKDTDPAGSKILKDQPNDSAFIWELRQQELKIRSLGLSFPSYTRKEKKDKLKNLYVDFHTRHLDSGELPSFEDRIKDYSYVVASVFMDIDTAYEYISQNFNCLVQPPTELLPESRRYKCPEKEEISKYIQQSLVEKKRLEIPAKQFPKELEKYTIDKNNPQLNEKHTYSKDSLYLIKKYQLDKKLLEEIDFDLSMRNAGQKIDSLSQPVDDDDYNDFLHVMNVLTEEDERKRIVAFRSDCVNYRLQNITFPSTLQHDHEAQKSLHSILFDFHMKYADASVLPEYRLRLAHLYFEIGVVIPDIVQAGQFIRHNFSILAQNKELKPLPSPDNRQIGFIIGLSEPPEGVDEQTFRRMSECYTKNQNFSESVLSFAKRSSQINPYDMADSSPKPDQSEFLPTIAYEPDSSEKTSYLNTKAITWDDIVNGNIQEDGALKRFQKNNHDILDAMSKDQASNLTNLVSDIGHQELIYFLTAAHDAGLKVDEFYSQKEHEKAEQLERERQERKVQDLALQASDLTADMRAKLISLLLTSDFQDKKPNL